MSETKDLRTLFKDYINECEYSTRLSPKTIKGYTDTFRLLLTVMPEITSKVFLTGEMLSEFFRRLQTRERTVGKAIIKQGIKNSTVRTYWLKLNVFFQWLVRNGHMEKNPLGAIKRPQLQVEESIALDKDSIRKLYTAITLHAQNTLTLRRDIAILSLLFFTGMRFNEFISLEVRDINFEKHFITIQGKTSKSRKARVLPLHPTLHLHLKEYISERKKYKTQSLIISLNKDMGLTSHGLRHWVKRLCAKSGIHFHIHQFRHTFACNLALHNIGAVKIQKLLGHSSVEMTMTYLRDISTESLDEEIQKLSL